MARSWVLAAVVVVGLSGFAAAAPLPAKADDSAVGKARQALDRKVSVSAENKSLVEVVEMLKESAKCELTLDTAALQQYGVDVNSPVVKCEVKDVKLRDALTKALAQHNLRCGPTAAGLLVTTEDALVRKQLRHRLDVDAADRPLGEVVKGLADASGAKVVFDPRPGKKLLDAPVTLKLEDVSVETAVRLAAEIGGGGVVRMDEVLFVTTLERAEKLQNESNRPLGPSNPNPLYPAVPVPFEGPALPPIGPPPVVDPVPANPGK